MLGQHRRCVLPAEPSCGRIKMPVNCIWSTKNYCSQPARKGHSTSSLMSVVFTPVTLFLVPAPDTRGSELFIPATLGTPAPPVVPHERGCRVAPALLPGRAGPARHHGGEAGPGRPSAVLAPGGLPSGDGTGAAQQCPCCAVSPRCVSEVTQEVPMSRSLPAAHAPLVLKGPQQPRAAKRSRHCPGAQTGAGQGREQTRPFARIHRFSRLQENVPWALSRWGWTGTEQEQQRDRHRDRGRAGVGQRGVASGGVACAVAL